MIGLELDSDPGKIFQYATINYDILGLIIEKVTGDTYENYMEQAILKPMGLNNTYLFRDESINHRIANGYKMGFLKARLYEAPIYRGNKPAGYIISNGEDMAKWLKIQMGTMDELNFDKDIISKSHDANKILDARANEILYAGGWYLEGNGQIYHDGMNPNYSSYIRFNKKEKIGLAVLSNISSNHVSNIGLGINGILHGEYVRKNIRDFNKYLDILAVVIIVICGFIIIGTLFLIIRILLDIFRGQRYFKFKGSKCSIKLIFSLVFILGLSYCIYLLGKVLQVSGPVIFVWRPSSLRIGLYSLYVTICFVYLYFILAYFFKKL